MAKLFANNGDPDQTLHYAASVLSLHCLPVTLLGVSRLKRVNIILSVSKSQKMWHMYSSQKHAYIILTPLNPTFI